MVNSKFVHIVFGYSAALALRDALARVDRLDTVANFPDHLEFGPINGTLDQRLDFYSNVMLSEPHPRLAQDLAAFWRTVEPNLDASLVWFSRDSAVEHTGFLELVSRCSRPPSYVDVAEVGVMRFAHVGPDQFVALKLLDRVRRQSSADFAADRARWNGLKEEDSPLRVVTASGIVSAPIDYFDDDIRACIADDWESGARVLGRATVKVNSGPYDQCSDSWIWSRVRHLVEESREFETKGDTSIIRECWLRRR